MSDQPEPSEHPHLERWRLHRSGVVDVWVYGIQEFDITGGRQILQGPNGSGKSRSLELQLPFCLDGELRYLGTKGANSVLMSRLMLDDYEAGPVRIGYCWVELRRVRAGTEEFVTCGVGVRAVKSSREIAASWRFITPLRVGHQFELVSADRSPVDMAELKARLGEEAVFERHRDFRARVASTVYGITDLRRYEDLLHLQRTLRNPDVGVKAATGDLENCLSLALPPLDQNLIAGLAGQFQDFEVIGDNIKRLRRAEQALAAFMGIYTGYTRGVLRERATALVSARKALGAHVLAVAKRGEEIESSKQLADNLDTEIEKLELRERGLTQEIRDMEDSDQFRELREIDRRRTAVAKRGELVDTHLGFANTARQAEARACEAVMRDLLSAYRVGSSFAAAVDDAAEKLEAIGLDRAILPTAPRLGEPTNSASVEYVLLSADPDAAPQQVTRVRPPSLDLDALAASTRYGIAQAALAAGAVTRQQSLIDTLLAESERLADLQANEIARLRFAADEAATAKDTAAEVRDKALLTLADQAQAGTRQQEEWLNVAPPCTVALEPRPQAMDSLTVSDDAVAAVALMQRRLRVWASPALEEVRDGLRRASLRFEELTSERQRIADERQALADGAPVAPPVPLIPRDERDGRTGAPFYRLIEFRTGLHDWVRGGLEGALQGSGLLDAWVYPDGTLDDAKLADFVALAPADALTGQKGGEGTLSRFLTASATDDAPVPAAVVERLLSNVRISDDVDPGSGGVSVSTTGRWRAGNLTGLYQKSVAEYVGETAREATRARRIEALDEALSTVRMDIEQVQVSLREGAEAQRRWAYHIDHVPELSGLVRAHAAAVVAETGHQEAVERGKRTAEACKQAEARWRAQHDEHMRQAGEANLPHGTVELGRSRLDASRASSACGELNGRAGELLLALAGLAPAITNFETTRQERESAERKASAEHREYREEFNAVNTLLDSLNLSASEFENRLAGLREELATVLKDIPTRRKEKDEAARRVARYEALAEVDERVGAEKAAAVTATEGAFAGAVRAPGFWMAATREAGPADPFARDVLEHVVAMPESSVDHQTVVNGVGRLNDGLPNGMHAELVSVGEAFAVEIRGVDGLRPAAVEARLLRERLEQDERMLDERYQVILEQYLLQDIAEHLRRQIDAAVALCIRMNEILAAAETSQGVRVQLAWEPTPVMDGETREALELVKKSLAARTSDEDDRLRRALQERIEAERERSQGDYLQALKEGLDYRKWYGFSVRVQDTDGEGRNRRRRFKNLSSGETRFVAYIVLIAAAAAFYDAIAESDTDPLRVVLLDEAFERIDDPTITKLLELLVELDMDWIITWPGGSAFSPKIDRMHVYDVLRRRNSRSIALMHTTWDGSAARRRT